MRWVCSGHSFKHEEWGIEVSSQVQLHGQPSRHQWKDESHSYWLVGWGSFEIQTCTRNLIFDSQFDWSVFRESWGHERQAAACRSDCNAHRFKVWGNLCSRGIRFCVHHRQSLFKIWDSWVRIQNAQDSWVWHKPLFKFLIPDEVLEVQRLWALHPKHGEIPAGTLARRVQNARPLFLHSRRFFPVSRYENRKEAIQLECKTLGDHLLQGAVDLTLCQRSVPTSAGSWEMLA